MGTASGPRRTARSPCWSGWSRSRCTQSHCYRALAARKTHPKFQLLGKVLGSAHSPGYPLYILVGHAFSRLPIATPAWRANFMSACFGAITVGVLYLIMRRAGAPRLSAFALALGAAAGRSFWWDSIVAEVPRWPPRSRRQPS